MNAHPTAAYRGNLNGDDVIIWLIRFAIRWAIRLAFFAWPVVVLALLYLRYR